MSECTIVGRSAVLLKDGTTHSPLGQGQESLS